MGRGDWVTVPEVLRALERNVKGGPARDERPEEEKEVEMRTP